MLEFEEWNVKGFGFHRELRTGLRATIVLDGDADGDADKWRRHDNYTCSIVIKFDFARTAYVDMDEIQGILQVQQGGKSEDVPQIFGIGFKGTVDVEKPSYVSEPFSVAAIVSNGMIRQTFESNEGRIPNGRIFTVHASARIPVHLRYQAPSNELYSRADIVHPPSDIWLGCDGALLSHSTNFPRLQPSPDFFHGIQVDNSMAWINLSAAMSYNSARLDTLAVPIPVGQVAHEGFVTITTSIITLGAALILSFLMLRPIKHHKAE